MSKEPENLKGQIERITYYNEENDYAVLKVKARSGLVTVVGTVASPVPGEILDMKGEWVIHPTFGEQFKISACKSSVPATVAGIGKYLGSGLIKGIGPRMANRIVSKFGEDTLDVLENSADRLYEIDGIGKHRVEMICKAWAEQKEVRSVMVFLQSNGVSSVYASKIYKKYGNDSIKVVRDNPYRLAYDIFGIGFVIADRIAKNLGFEENSPQRAEAGIMFALLTTINEGHVFFPSEGLLSRSQELLQIEKNVLEQALDSLQKENKVVMECLTAEDGEVRAVYLPGYHLSETRCAEMLNEINKAPRSIKEMYATPCIRYAQKKLDIVLADRQKEALQSAVENKITVITGGPGTGKTTITRSIVEILSLRTKNITLAAPTGRAAKRMSEATGKQAKTIHRLLEFGSISGKFGRDEENPLDCDAIIIDEASMIDNLLMYHLLKAIPKEAVVILVGDINQLPSVGAGNVLKDIINSHKFAVIELNEIFRQAESSGIVLNAHRIIKGNSLSLEGHSDFQFMPVDDPHEISDCIVDLVKNQIPAKFGFDSRNDIQVLTPMNKGMIGTIGLNESLQHALNPREFEIVYMGRKYRIGDKIMQVKNDYDKEVYNGDIGIITDINTENKDVFAKINDRIIKYEYAELDELVLAYAISIHKSQGSEYPAVVIPMSMSHYVMLQRNLFYTGVTRGKQLVMVVGSKKAMHAAIRNNRIIERNTWLEHRLKTSL